MRIDRRDWAENRPWVGCRMKNNDIRHLRIVKDSAVRDGLIGLAVILVAFGVSVAFDVAELWRDFAHQHKGYQLEELPIFTTILSVVLAWYSFRRWREMTLISAVRRRLNGHLEVLLSRESVRARQLAEIKEMDQGLLAAEDSREACDVAIIHLRQIFPFGSGAFYLVRKGLESLVPIGGWGAFADSPPPEIEAGACKGLSADGYRGGTSCPDGCESCRWEGAEGMVCVPITGQGKTYGVLQLLYGGRFGDLPQTLASKSEFDQMCHLAGVVCRTIGQHLANIGLRRRLYDESWRDPLTGLLNRRGLDRFVDREMARLIAEGDRMAVLMMDVDGFKGVNDKFGHEIGDSVLEAVGRSILAQCRTRDIVCRLGGDEFLVALPSAGLDVARERAEMIRMGVIDLAATRRDLAVVDVTLSVGVAMFPDDGADWDSVVAAADAALYSAKGAGKNRVAVGG